MKRRNKHFWFVVIAAAIPFVGYGIMHGLTYLFPMSEDTPYTHLFYTVILIALGLLIPYWMLKTGIHAAHLRDPGEKELQLKDIPKDKDQLDAQG